MSDDESTRKAQKPVISLALGMKLLQEHWGMAETDFTKLKTLESYDDANMFVEVGDKRYLLKVHNGVESDNAAILDAQTAMLTFLAGNGIRTNSPVPSSVTKEPIVMAEVPVVDGSRRHCAIRLYSWVDGSPLVGNATVPLLVQAGQLLGNIQNLFVSKSFNHPGLSRYHVWDLKNTPDIRPFLKHITVAENRQLVERVIKKFEETVLPVADQLRKGPLQADFNDANIILPGKTGEPCGVIDFGDIVHSWVVNDIAIAAAYASVSSIGHEQPFTAAAAMLHGAATQLELTELERQLLPILAASRLAISVTLGAYSIAQQPECTYLLLHAEPGWRSLRALMAPAFQDDIAGYFTEACVLPLQPASVDTLAKSGNELMARYSATL